MPTIVTPASNICQHPEEGDTAVSESAWLYKCKFLFVTEKTITYRAKKLRIYNTYKTTIRPVLTYDSEAWTHCPKGKL